MQCLTLHGTSSGKLGGVVASHGRAGAQLRAHTLNRQPRSSSQQQARALTGSLPSRWRALSAAQRASWSALAVHCVRRDRLGVAHTLAGYALFVSCSRNLLTASPTSALTTARTPIPLPALLGLAATPLYNDPLSPTVLLGFTLTWAPLVSLGSVGVLRASQPLSKAKANIRTSDLRIVQVLAPCPASSVVVNAGWLSIWGDGPATGRVTFTLTLIDPISGFSGVPISCFSDIAYSHLNPYVPGNVTIEFEGTPEAVLSDQVIEFEGNPQAGG